MRLPARHRARDRDKPHGRLRRAAAKQRRKGGCVQETAKLTLSVEGGREQTIDLPIITGTENEKAIDISSLRSKTGYVCLDPAFVNTASTTSSITFLDGEQGILRYRGIPIEQLGEKSTFAETSYLLIYGKLP